ncbi:MAG: type 4a pilus biogenesis protein PilO [Patescibacteria group bacterium]
MKASSKRTLSILLSIFLFIGSLAIYSYLISPAYEKIKTQKSEIVSRAETVRQYEEIISRIKNLLEQYENAAQMQETMSVILPTNQNVAESINQINGLAYFNNLSIDRLSVRQMAIAPSADKSKLIKGIGTLRINIRFNGDYAAIKSFLQNMETNLNLMDLISLRAEPIAAGVRGSNFFDYVAEIDTYYQAEQ